MLLFFSGFALVLFGEWYQFLRGFNTSLWTFSNWMVFALVIVAEAAAVAIITITLDRALPAVGNRAPARETRQPRRGSQKYRTR